MSQQRLSLLAFVVSVARVPAQVSECSEASAEGEEACLLQAPRVRKAPLVILDRSIKDTWGYTASEASGLAHEFVYTDPCNITSGLSWHATLPYMNGITLQCLKANGCSDQFKPQDKGGFKYINLDIYVPPSNGGSCSRGDLFGQELSDDLMMQLLGEDKKLHSMPSPLKRDNKIKKSDRGMYSVCQTIPHMQQDPMHGEWARISIQNWPMQEKGHQGTFEIYLDKVVLADTCLD